MSPTIFLHKTTVHNLLATANRIHIQFHLLITLSVFYHRLSTLIYHDASSYTKFSPTAWICMILAELILALLWFFSQSFRWRPVTREVYPEKLPKDRDLPRLDVFVCTADPSKEPTLQVMNTVISAMCLDYPPEKFAIYLSDDASADVTLKAMRESVAFAQWWVPFCQKYSIKERCPEVYFSGLINTEICDIDFKDEEENIKYKYEHFKKLVSSGGDVTQDNDANSIFNDCRAPLVQVIHDNRSNNDGNDINLPLLVYVSRERRPSYPNRFKAGALNVLIRVSGIMSNGPYIAVLDCDMYCNDPTSAKQAMCLHLDPSISSELSFVQFPQVFHNVTKNDIYDAQTRIAFKTMWRGMDGLMGPVLTGTGYYLKREALYGSPDHQKGSHSQQRDALTFGDSNMFLASINNKSENARASTKELLHEAHLLARCSFETATKWGYEIGYLYECLLESTFTGYYMQCKGWTSMYLYPKKPAFLGCAPIDMKDGIIQLRKWSENLLGLGFSKFSPLTYVISSKMSFLHSMCYAYFSFMPLYAISFLIYGIVPQFCFIKGIPIFPKVNEAWFIVFVSLWLSSLLQNMYEVFVSEGTLRTWWNEQRIWVIKSMTGCFFGCIDLLVKKLHNSKTMFRLTNKSISEKKFKNYEKGKFDFEGAQVFMAPVIALVIWNLICFIGGLWSIIERGNVCDMFGQLLLSTFVLLLSYPIVEGMVIRNGKENK